MDDNLSQYSTAFIRLEDLIEYFPPGLSIIQQDCKVEDPGAAFKSTNNP